MRNNLVSHRPAAPCAQRGMGLIDALVALVILSFGMLAIAGFQARLLSQGTDANTRVQVSAYADELISYALVDVPNRSCYQTSTPSSCTAAPASAIAASYVQAWQVRVASAVPGYQSASSALDAAGRRLVVSIRWASKNNDQDIRELEATTDVSR
jgi:type IV pilus assembly protein PilV